MKNLRLINSIHRKPTIYSITHKGYKHISKYGACMRRYTWVWSILGTFVYRKSTNKNSRYHMILFQNTKETKSTSFTTCYKLEWSRHVCCWYIESYWWCTCDQYKDPMTIVNTVRKSYELKGVGAPEYYLGGDHLWREK